MARETTSKSSSRDYDDDSYEREYRSRHDRELKNRRDGGSCWPKFLVFLLFLGGGLGAFFGLIDLDTMEGWFGVGSGGGGGDNDGNSGGSGGGPAYNFNQCPDDGSECCNGLESNCDLRINEMLYATVHNANHDDLLVNNHDAPFEGSLDAGYRSLMFDVCRCDDNNGNAEIVFCHASCGIGERNPTEVFENVDKFLNDNPNEFIIFNFEMNRPDVNPPQQAELWDIVAKIDSFKKKIYNHSGNEWPTGRETIESGKRVFFFQHNGWYLCNTGNEAECNQRIENFHDYAIETDWAFGDIEEIENTATSCIGTRGELGSKDFYAINNFVTTFIGPSKFQAETLNSKDFALKRIEDCKSVTNLDANFLNVDFWQRGDIPEVAQIINIQRGQKNKRSLRRFLRWIRN
uniref:Phosphatidylinositol-specific phospholipase C X domain-containing protein n=2 Tax=Chaetoceros debilis TaxID=122233 RepID=A0A7S3Q815_9STRA|mmetsp:Transcript_4951/g.7285  ORF Transcript_4951/g.7285 Transcript_4951/m.7285 type:complete len:404 (-) Transcript_4951:121-1332(-)